MRSDYTGTYISKNPRYINLFTKLNDKLDFLRMNELLLTIFANIDSMAFNQLPHIFEYLVDLIERH